MSEFLDVLGILWQHGHIIMENFAEVQEQSTSGKFYDCVFGNAFLTDLFTENRTENAKLYYFTFCKSLQAYNNKTKIQPGFIYHFQLETELTAEEPSAFESQVHFFTIIYDETPLLLQTLGGVEGILIKRIYGDINEILHDIVKENSETFARLFEVPPDLEDLTYYKIESMYYLKVPLYYPTLTDLDSILSKLGLDYASEKISYLI